MNDISYVKEINSLDEEIKRLTSRLKDLRSQRKICSEKLYAYMEKNNIESINQGKIKLNKIKPKDRKKTRPKKERTQETIKLLRDAGIPNPSAFFNQIETLKISNAK